MTLPEFTCLCPKTGQPDFATFELEYVPDELCVELKALKLYLWSYRDRGAFHEAVTNQIADDLAGACAPRFLRLAGKFNVRGGIYTTVVVERRKPGWKAAASGGIALIWRQKITRKVAVFTALYTQKLAGIIPRPANRPPFWIRAWSDPQCRPSERLQSPQSRRKPRNPS